MTDNVTDFTSIFCTEYKMELVTSAGYPVAYGCDRTLEGYDGLDM
jgi:hypothetical protein